MAKNKVTDADIDRLAEINRELDKRTNRTKKYIELEQEALSLKKAAGVLEKEMEKIRNSEEGIQRRINSAIKDREGSMGGILKSIIKMDLSSASELINKRKVSGLSKDLAESQDSLAKSLADDVKKGKISVTDRAKILKIQDGIASGKIKENDIGGKLQGLSAKGLKNSKEYGKHLKGQAVNQKDIGNLISKSTGGLAKWGAKLGGFATIAVGVFKLISQFSAKIDEVGKTFGFLTNKNKDFRNDLIQSGNNAMMLGKSLSDVLSVTSALASEYGLTLQDAEDLSLKVLDTAVATGLSNDEATKLFGTFMQIGNLTSKQAENLIEGTAQLAAQKGVAPQAVLKDMAASSEEIAKFTKGTGENIAEAAIQARQMGISLQTTSQIAEGLLDFESSIAKEVEASVMIGKQLNFQRARQLALQGDMTGMMDDVLKQLGSEAEFNKLNVLQRKSLAQSLGVSVTQMNKLVSGAEKLTLSGALAGKNFDDLVGQDSLSALTQITNAMKQIGATILDTFGAPLAEMLSQFTGPDGLTNIKKALVSIANIFISIIRAGQDFINIFRPFWNDFTLMERLEVTSDGNIQKKANDYRGGRGGISVMAGPAGVFRLNPMDSVIATTNPISTNDFGPQPAGSVGNGRVEVFGELKSDRGVLLATIESPPGGRPVT